MTKLLTALISLAFFISGCTNNNDKARTSIKFTSFEIGYTNGWTRGISFWVDSNRIFFAPQESDKVKYGLLPDSLNQLINETLTNIFLDTTIKSKDDGCVDCEDLGIRAVVGSDTLYIRQVGKLDKIFLPFLKKLEYFIESSNHSTIHSVLFLESQKIAFPPKMSLFTNKSIPPDSLTKSGR